MFAISSGFCRRPNGNVSVFMKFFQFSSGDAREHVIRLETNADGRTDQQILPASQFELGQYELVFHAGEYLLATGQAGPEPKFLDVIPIRFGMALNDHYHVPLLLSPYGYSTYRGS